MENKIHIKFANLQDVTRGQEFIRLIGGAMPMPVIVGEQDEDYVWVGSIDGRIPGTKEEGWKFDKRTSVEIDEYLGWTNERSGSFLIEK